MAPALLNRRVKRMNALFEGEMMNGSKITKSCFLLSLLVGALMLSGCGARTTGLNGSTDDLASRSVIQSAANCNSFSSNQTQLAGKLEVYVDPLGQVVT